jgi:hypothetical protein
MWNESGAAIGDFTRVVALVRSQYVILRAHKENLIDIWTCAE